MNNRIFFSSLHPAFLFAYFAAVLIVTMFVQNPLILLLSLCGAALFSIFTVKREKLARTLIFTAVLFLLISLTNPLFSHNGVTVIFYIGDTPFTLESLLYGVNASVMVSAVILWFVSINAVMTDDKSEYLFARAVPKISLVITMILRFIPLYKKQTESLSDAQKGLGVSSDKLKDKLHNAATLFLSLVSWSLENSVDTGLSMKARGYGEQKKRTSFSTFAFTVRDFGLCAACALALAIIAVGLYARVGEFPFYPTIGVADSSLKAVLTYIGFGFLSLLPSACEITENIKWKYYLSKN